MSAAQVPIRTPQPHAAGSHARRLTTLAYAVNAAYLVWFWLMFALGYGVYGLFGIDPGTGATLREQGLLGWVALAAYGLLAGVPSMVGAIYARRARHAGAGSAATAALAINLALAVGWVGVIVATG